MKEYLTKPTFLITFLVICIHLAASRAHGLGNETDYMALLAIKSRLVDNPASVLRSWNNSLHHCHWEGVTCSPKHNRVIKLNLTSRGLVGTISPFIGNLSFLTNVLLYNNSLVGQIPPELSRLSRLEVLGLNNNTLEGAIPTNLSACINLQKLSIGFNKLEGKLPLGLRSLSKLRLLSVHYNNNLTGPLFEIISNITCLEVISVAVNAFTGNIPTSIGKMLNLNALYLEYNDLSGTIPTSILNCTLLYDLFLNMNHFHGELPPDIGLKLPHLVHLDFSSNQFSGAFPHSILNLTSIEWLVLSNNNLIGRVPHDFGTLHNLWQLGMGFNYLEGDINFVGSLVNCSKLGILVLGGNEFTGTLPKSIANLSTSLQVFFLDYNGITGEIPAGITNLLNLQIIAFYNNELTGSIPRDLGKLPKLERLYLFNNSLTGNIPDTLGNLSRLSEIDLNDNHLEGKIPPSLGSCQSLLDLNLSSNLLNGTIVELFEGNAKFISVDLSDNLLEGPIPLEISKQINLVELYLSRNRLSGIIPYGLGGCLALTTLDIHANSLQGHIPSSFSSLDSLQTIDFSRNNLSGAIPNYLSKFPLQSLNLSYNKFEGEVPTRGVFANTNEIALNGNINLCGGIPKLHLPKCMQQKGRKQTRKTSHTQKFDTIEIVSIIAACIFVGVLFIGSVTCIYLTLKKKKRAPSSSSSIGEQLMKVSYDMLLKATNGFSLENLVGAGSFGSVFRGKLDGTTIAVKVLNLQTRGASASFMAECKALRNVRHRNLVGIVTACSSIDFHRNDFKALVYEFMPNGSLDKWLHGNREEKLTLLQRVDVAVDVAHALNYLHHECEASIVHCDLKPSNILLDSDMVARVGDFGLAKFLAQPQDPNQSSSFGIRGTVGYAAPEYGIGSEPSPEGDLYSYGITLLELMTGKSPTDNSFQEDYNLHTYAEAAFPENVLQIIDSTLGDNEITAEVGDIRTVQLIAQRRAECIVSVISVGVACSRHLPQDRMKINDVISELRVARDNLCNAGLRRNFPNGIIRNHHSIM